jgi:hypothetical protein
MRIAVELRAMARTFALHCKLDNHFGAARQLSANKKHGLRPLFSGRDLRRNESRIALANLKIGSAS